MAMRVLCIASSFAAASVVYKADQISRRDTGESKRYSPCSQCNDEKSKIQRAIERTREQIIRLKNEVGAPGIVVGVSVDGKIIWKEGIGFLDLENQVPANEDTVMRIASISKSLTAAVIGRLWQEGIIDIDQPIQKYVPSFPEKTFRDGKVTITTRQLMCHLSGIRHYSKLKKDDSLGAGDGQLGEFYGKERYESIEKALSIFKNDELLHPPGSEKNAASVLKNLDLETNNIISSTGGRVLSASGKMGREDDASTSILGEESKRSLTNVDRLKEAGGYAGAAGIYLWKGVTNASSYIWDKVGTTSEKQEEKTVGEDDVSASRSVERLKDVGSHVTTAMTYIGQGIANASSYVRGKVWSTTGNETEKGD